MLVPPILTRILQTDHASSNTEERLAEISLIQICISSFKQAIVHAITLSNQLMPAYLSHGTDSAHAAAAVDQKTLFVRFVKHLLHHFRQCVKSVLVTFMEKNQLRKVLLIDEALDGNVTVTTDEKKKPKNYRLGLFQALIASGDQLAELLLSNEPVAVGRDTSDSSHASLATADDWKQIKDTFLTMIDDTSN